MRIGLELPPQVRVYGAFFIYSLGMGGIFPRLGDIQKSIGVEQGALGLALIGTAVGTLISLSFASNVLDRVGYRAILVLIPFLSLCFAMASFATGPLALFLLLLPAGLTIGAIELVVNLEADRVEHQIGRRIMNRCHGFWSLGFFSAGLIGALMAQLGISAQVDLLIMVPVITLATILVLGKFEPAPHRAGGHVSTGPSQRIARPTLAIMVLVAVTLSAMIMEGAGSDWSAIYMRDVFHADPFLAGIAVSAGALMQGFTRFFADGFVERFSPVNVARVLLTVLGLGALLVFFAPAAWVALVGLGLMGVGTSAIFPLAMSAAAQRTDRPAAMNVAALAQTSFVAFLVGPPLLGLVAEAFGVRWSFGIGLPLVVVSLALAGALGKKPIPPDVDAVPVPLVAKEF